MHNLNQGQMESANVESRRFFFIKRRMLTHLHHKQNGTSSFCFFNFTLAEKCILKPTSTCHVVLFHVQTNDFAHPTVVKQVYLTVFISISPKK